MKTKLYFIGFLFLAIISAKCTATEKPKEFDYGQVVNGKYNNPYFGFEISIPTDWIVQNKEQSDQLRKKGEELIAGDNKQFKSVIKASEINSANLLIVFKYEQGAAVNFNPGVVFVAENLKNFPGIKNGSDYLFNARKMIKQSQMQISYMDSVYKKETIGNHVFYSMNVTGSSMGQEYKQVYYSTILQRFSVSFIISYGDDKQKAELDKIINTLKFTD